MTLDRLPSGAEAAPLVSVVVPVWNNAAVLPRCLAALRRQSASAFELIAVDDGSSDRSGEVVTAEVPEARLVRLDENRGFSAAVNAGIRAARGSYVAVLNSDTEPREDWLAALVACLERHPGAACVDSKVVRLDRPDVIDGAGDGMTWSLKAYRRGLGERDVGQYDAEEEVFSASGTACLWRRDVLEAIGLFDESFFAYYEDVDLGFRARLAGYEVWYTPDAVVRHVGSASTRSRRREFEARALTNRWAVILRNAPVAWLRRHWAAIALGELLLAARLFATGNPLPVLRAYVDVVRHSRTWLRERTARQTAAHDLDAWRPLVHEAFPSLRLSLHRRA